MSMSGAMRLAILEAMLHATADTEVVRTHIHQTLPEEVPSTCLPWCLTADEFPMYFKQQRQGNAGTQDASF